MKSYGIRTAFILGAGLGTRLRPLTDNLPKPLLPVGGRPLITYAMDHCLTAGIERFIVNTHHCAAAYGRAFPGGHWRRAPILFSHEPILLDTAGGLKNIEELLDRDEAILVYNGDIFSDLPLSRLLAAHAAEGKEVTLALRNEGPLRNVALDQEGAICDLRGILGNPGVRRCLFTGISVVEKRLFRRLTPGIAASTIPVFAQMIRECPGSVGGVVIDEGVWMDIGDVETYDRIRAAGPLPAYEKRDGGTETPSPSSVPLSLVPVDAGSTTTTTASAVPDSQWEAAGPEARALIERTLGLPADTVMEIAPIGKGGSDRAYFRVTTDRSTVVLMRYGTMYEENDRYMAVASFLRGIGVAVPAIYAHDPGQRLILAEDLGDVDLYGLRDAPWEVRRGLYERTLALAAKMHAFSPDRLPAGLRLMPGFDAGLYKWERDYFLEHCVRSVCLVSLTAAEEEALEAELALLAGRLMAMPVSLIHRDLQSQNVMIRHGEPVLIDFQGMRSGNPLYDLGSLLCDPYVIFREEERNHLLCFYRQITDSRVSGDLFRDLFLLASAQRLMQALGAYGFLGLRRGKTGFLAHIPHALDLLAAVTGVAGSLPRLHGLALRCRGALEDSSA